MWRSLSSRLALRSALGLKYGSKPKPPGTSGRSAAVALSVFEASIMVFASFQFLQYCSSMIQPGPEQQQEEPLMRDVEHLRLPPVVEFCLHGARMCMGTQREGAMAGAFVHAAHAARRAAEAGVLSDELLVKLGEMFAEICTRQPSILYVLASEHFADAEERDAWRAPALENVHRSMLALMLRDRDRAQEEDRPLPLRWLAVAALSTPATMKPLVEKLLAESLDVNRSSEERAGVLPILMDFNVPGIRHVQLAAVARLAAEDTSSRRMTLATSCIKLAGGLVNDVRLRNAHLPGPRDATFQCARHLHSTALRFLPSEADARSPLTISEELRDAFGRLYYPRALMSLTMSDNQFFRNLDAALSWYGPGDTRHASLRTLRDFVMLQGVQAYREEHGKEFEIEL